MRAHTHTPRVSFRDPDNAMVVDKLVKEVQGANPEFQSGLIRGLYFAHLLVNFCLFLSSHRMVYSYSIIDITFPPFYSRCLYVLPEYCSGRVLEMQG